MMSKGLKIAEPPRRRQSGAGESWTGTAKSSRSREVRSCRREREGPVQQACHAPGRGRLRDSRDPHPPQGAGLLAEALELLEEKHGRA